MVQRTDEIGFLGWSIALVPRGAKWLATSRWWRHWLTRVIACGLPGAGMAGGVADGTLPPWSLAISLPLIVLAFLYLGYSLNMEALREKQEQCEE